MQLIHFYLGSQFVHHYLGLAIKTHQIGRALEFRGRTGFEISQFKPAHIQLSAQPGHLQFCLKMLAVVEYKPVGLPPAS